MKYFLIGCMACLIIAYVLIMATLYYFYKLDQKRLQEQIKSNEELIKAAEEQIKANEELIKETEKQIKANEEQIEVLEEMEEMLLELGETEEKKEIVVIKDKGEKYTGSIVIVRNNKIYLDTEIFNVSSNVKWYTYYPKQSLTVKHQMI